MRKIYWSVSIITILFLIRSTITLRSGLILILRVFFVFCSWIVRISDSNWLNLSLRRSDIRRPVKTPIVINKQNLYSLSRSSFPISDLKSSQFKLEVVVFWPFKLIIFWFCGGQYYGEKLILTALFNRNISWFPAYYINIGLRRYGPSIKGNWPTPTLLQSIR